MDESSESDGGNLLEVDVSYADEVNSWFPEFSKAAHSKSLSDTDSESNSTNPDEEEEQSAYRNEKQSSGSTISKKKKNKRRLDSASKNLLQEPTSPFKKQKLLASDKDRKFVNSGSLIRNKLEKSLKKAKHKREEKTLQLNNETDSEDDTTSKVVSVSKPKVVSNHGNTKEGASAGKMDPQCRVQHIADLMAKKGLKKSKRKKLKQKLKKMVVQNSDKLTGDLKAKIHRLLNPGAKALKTSHKLKVKVGDSREHGERDSIKWDGKHTGVKSRTSILSGVDTSQEDPSFVREKPRRKKKKTRSKQKNIKKDHRPDHLKPLHLAKPSAC